MVKNWRKRNISEKVVESLSKELRKSRTLIKILISRGQDTPQKAEKFLNPKIEDAENPFVFPDMKKAATKFAETILKNEPIGIFSDADADGISGAAIIYNFLLDANFPKNKIITRVPSRDKEGYGLSREFIDEAHKKGVKLIITADCGVRNHFEISYAKSFGIDVIVCDHHQMDYSLPKDAYAILHPKTIEGETQISFLSGAGVAFELVAGTRKILKNYGKNLPKPRNYLDLLSIGTVGDMVPLLGDNRIFVKHGLKILSDGSGNMGLKALINRANIKQVSTYDLQMKIIPRINSSGRAGKPEMSFFLLTEQNLQKIMEISDKIEEVNSWRKGMVQAIIDEIEFFGLDQYKNRYSIVAWGENWPEGVIGLVASRILEKTGKPTCIISVREDEARGSIRSPDYLNIMGILDKISYLLRKYGGHAQAAGIVLDPKNIEEFEIEFENQIRQNLRKIPEIIIEYDDEIFLENIRQKEIYELMELEPFGEGNPFPTFLIDCDIVESRVVGEKHLKLYAKSKDGKIPMIAFGVADKIEPFLGKTKVIARLIPSQIYEAEFEIIEFLS